ncbi:unnamed protein product [Rhodiola kirilowii]
MAATIQWPVIKPKNDLQINRLKELVLWSSSCATQRSKLRLWKNKKFMRTRKKAWNLQWNLYFQGKRDQNIEITKSELHGY